MIAVAFIVVMGFLNRVRGGGFGVDRLPGHGRIWAAAGVCLASLLIGPVWMAPLIAGAWLLWAAPSWGYLITLGRFTPQREMTSIEADLLKFTTGNVWAALWLRMMLVSPLMAVAALDPFMAALGIPLAAVIVLAYEIAWRAAPSVAIPVAETATGALIGASILAVS